MFEGEDVLRGRVGIVGSRVTMVVHLRHDVSGEHYLKEPKRCHKIIHKTLKTLKFRDEGLRWCLKTIVVVDFQHKQAALPHVLLWV